MINNPSLFGGITGDCGARLPAGTVVPGTEQRYRQDSLTLVNASLTWTDPRRAFLDRRVRQQPDGRGVPGDLQRYRQFRRLWRQAEPTDLRNAGRLQVLTFDVPPWRAGSALCGPARSFDGQHRTKPASLRFATGLSATGLRQQVDAVDNRGKDSSVARPCESVVASRPVAREPVASDSEAGFILTGLLRDRSEKSAVATVSSYSRLTVRSSYSL